MSGSVKKSWPGETDEAHPEIFTTIPPQPAQLKPGQLPPDQVKKYFEEGFVVIDSFFKPEELDPGKDAINNIVDELAQKLFKAGKVKSLYSEYGYEKRLTMLEADYPGSNIVMHKIGRLPQAIRDIWSNERLMNLAEQLLGTADLMGSPVWNLRCKTPGSVAATVAWHQDVAYFDNNSYKVHQLICWIPMVDANVDNGCLQIVRYGHKMGRVGKHQGCDADTWYLWISEEEMRKTLECDLDHDIVTLPVKYGGLVLFNNLIPHKSLMNSSDTIRWSLDLRFQAADSDPSFYGLKKGVRMRSAADPTVRPDWEPFDAISRHDTHRVVDELDMTIVGPWMLKWEITHHNRHTEALSSCGDFTSWHSVVG